MPSPPDDRSDQNQNPPNNTGAAVPNPSPYLQAPHAGPPQLPPETYNYLIHALLSLQGSASAPHAYLQNHPPTYPYPVPPAPLPNYHYPWPSNTIPSVPTSPVAGPSSFYPTNPPIPPVQAASQATGSSQLAIPPAASIATASTAQDQEGPEDATSITEDKRRRNTAASARFRIKKKLKTLNLERTVADLAGRTEELEREATDLRRENAWLKEIVLLKGRNIAALNLASQPPAAGSRPGEDEEDDHAHVESEPESTSKREGKGKSREC